MIKNWKELDPNEIVTKKYLDIKLNEQLEEFKRYTRALSEEFQSRLSAVAEIVLANREEIIKHREILSNNNLC